MSWNTILKTIRLEKKMSVEMLSLVTGYSRQHIYYVERDKRTPSIHYIEDVLQALGYKLEVTKNGNTAKSTDTLF